MRIALGSDHLGFHLKQVVLACLRAQGHEVSDFGTFYGKPVDYPDIAVTVAESVRRGESERGILVCGTGLGMAIAANKVPGILAACVDNVYSAKLAAEHNYAQIITLGASILGPGLALSIVDAFLASDTRNEDSARKVAKILALEERYRRRRLEAVR